MRVRVLYFGVLRETMGRSDEAMELGEGATVEELGRILRGRASNSSMEGMGKAEVADVGAGANAEDRLWRSLAVAVNREYVALDVVLHDGDEVALLPPVSGGCFAHRVTLARTSRGRQ
ncbi:MAG: MoaD/ThiS family protein [Acidobacteriaceae bacterium]|jgi:molybdopterin converting factor small subunit